MALRDGTPYQFFHFHLSVYVSNTFLLWCHKIVICGVNKNISIFSIPIHIDWLKDDKLIQESSLSEVSNYSIRIFTNILSCSHDIWGRVWLWNSQNSSSDWDCIKPGDFLIVKVSGNTKDAVRIYFRKVLYTKDDEYAVVI